MRREQKFCWDRLSLGVCYYPEHWNPDLWREDLQRMRENGIESLRVAEFAWSIFEPEEGTFSFELFDRFLDLAQQGKHEGNFRNAYGRASRMAD